MSVSRIADVQAVQQVFYGVMNLDLLRFGFEGEGQREIYFRWMMQPGKSRHIRLAIPAVGDQWSIKTDSSDIQVKVECFKCDKVDSVLLSVSMSGTMNWIDRALDMVVNHEC